MCAVVVGPRLCPEVFAVITAAFAAIAAALVGAKSILVRRCAARAVGVDIPDVIGAWASICRIICIPQPWCVRSVICTSVAVGIIDYCMKFGSEGGSRQAFSAVVIILRSLCLECHRNDYQNQYKI